MALQHVLSSRVSQAIQKLLCHVLQDLPRFLHGAFWQQTGLKHCHSRMLADPLNLANQDQGGHARHASPIHWHR